uniref:Putative ovule protein n=1 Tax=Solanum chacoense TaxID=4108 RepID=A0A0V0II94_SOLCH
MMQSTPGTMQDTPPMRFVTTRKAALMKIAEVVIITSEREIIESDECELVTEVAHTSVSVEWLALLIHICRVTGFWKVHHD